jgi:2'-5' RNA ligase
MAVARLFVALDLPQGVRDALAGWAREVAADQPEALRAVRADAMHVTLCFLGDRPEEEMSALAALVADARIESGQLTVTGASWLPPRRPGVLAVDLHDPDGWLHAGQGRLADALVEAGAYAPEQRAFRPHVTVARVRRGDRPRRAVPDPPAETFTSGAVRLYRSRLGAGGSRYEVVPASTRRR